MKRKKRFRPAEDLPCADLDADDGVDPRKFFGNYHERKIGHKVRRLCGQVARTLDLVFAGECDDHLLRNLAVHSVTPAPDATRLSVVVYFTTPDAVVDARDVLDRLARARGMLRSAVAAVIERKRTPELAFRVAGPGEVPQ